MKAIGKGRCRVEAAVLSPTGLHLAVSSEVKRMLGLKSRRAGFVFTNKSMTIVGRIVEGKVEGAEWHASSAG